MVILCCSIPGVSASSAAREEVAVAELIAAQKEAVEANEVLMQYFFEEGWVIEYPDYFGGCYIEDNILHIILVEPTTEETRILDALLSDYKDVTAIEYGSYSQASLQDYADNAATELKEQGLGVTHWYVDVETGNVIIGVISDDMGSANAKVAQMQDYVFKNLVPKIVIEEGAYTSAANT